MVNEERSNIIIPEERGSSEQESAGDSFTPFTSERKVNSTISKNDDDDLSTTKNHESLTKNHQTSSESDSEGGGSSKHQEGGKQQEGGQQVQTTTSNQPNRQSSLLMECLLCAETVPPKHQATYIRSCQCKVKNEGTTTCCQSCFYRHITSIWDDSASGGKRPLTCPLGCGQALTDTEIRSCLHQQHFHWFWNLVGKLFIYKLFLIFYGCTNRSTIPGSMESCLQYRFYLYCCHTQQERRDLERYERWSIATGLKDARRSQQQQVNSNNGNQNDDDENITDNNQRDDGQELCVQYCPAPDCNYAWIVANPSYRRRKQAHEQRRVFLWYKAMKKEESPSCQWVDAEYVHYGSPSTPPPAFDWDDQKSLRDGRRMVCAKCHYVFCGLCKQPWRFLQNQHPNMSCQAYARLLPRGGGVEDLATVAGCTVGARACPGCHTITSRISGCNHITCPCGKEWCYVCGANWNSFHYSCRTQQSTNRNANDCVIL